MFRKISPTLTALTEEKSKNCLTKLEATELTLEGYHPPFHNLESEGRGGMYMYTFRIFFGVDVFNWYVVMNKSFKSRYGSVWNLEEIKQLCYVVYIAAH